MKKQEFIRLAEKYAKGHCTKEEEVLVEALFDKLQEKLLGWELTDEEEKRMRILQKVKAGIKTHDRLIIHPTISWRRLTGIAASVLIVIGLAVSCYFTFGGESRIEQIAHRGVRKEILLNDGTIVHLNSESSLIYPEKFSEVRELTLRGEAFFQVAKDPDRPFVVKTGDIETTVLGTSFNITAYEEKDIRISVNTGKVQITSQGQKVFLIPNEQVICDKNSGNFTVIKTDAERHNAWTRNIILMENNTLREVADMLEKWYDVEFVFENQQLESHTITGKYKAGELRDILESIRFLKRIDYVFENPKKIIIKENTRDESVTS